jgi:hypothetical protein
MDGWYQVYCTTMGDTKALAFEGAEHVLNALAFGRTAAIRVRPEASSDTDFDTKETHHKGIVRFIYRLDAGEWHYPEPTMTIPFASVA